MFAEGREDVQSCGRERLWHKLLKVLLDNCHLPSDSLKFCQLKIKVLTSVLKRGAGRRGRSRGILERLFALYALLGHRDRGDCLQARRGVLTRNQLCWQLELGPLGFRIVRKQNSVL